MIKTAAVAVCASLFAVVIGKANPDMALLLGICTLSVIIFAFGDYFSDVADFLNSVMERTGLDGELLTIIFKSVAVSVIVKMSSDICRDAKQSALASTIELCGSGAVLCIAMPLINEFIRMIDSLIS